MVLYLILNAYVLRDVYRMEDIEKDVVLPSIKHENVFLDLDQFCVRAYNLQQGSVAVNAVDSERKDQVRHIFYLLICWSDILFRIICFTPGYVATYHSHS